MNFNPFSWFAKEVPIVEADIARFAAKVWQGIPVLESEIVGVVNWITGTGIPNLTTAIAEATPIIDAVGGTANPALPTEMAALNAAMATLNAFAANANKNNLSAAQVVEGYSALKSAASAASQVVSTSAGIIAKAGG